MYLKQSGLLLKLIKSVGGRFIYSFALRFSPPTNQTALNPVNVPNNLIDQLLKKPLSLDHPKLIIDTKKKTALKPSFLHLNLSGLLFYKSLNLSFPFIVGNFYEVQTFS